MFFWSRSGTGGVDKIYGIRQGVASFAGGRRRVRREAACGDVADAEPAPHSIRGRTRAAEGNNRRPCFAPEIGRTHFSFANNGRLFGFDRATEQFIILSAKRAKLSLFFGQILKLRNGMCSCQIPHGSIPPTKERLFFAREVFNMFLRAETES